MKHLLLLILLLNCWMPVWAKNAYEKSDFGCTTDTCLVNRLLASYRSIAQSNIDSAFFIADFCLNLSRKNGYDNGEVWALRLKADAYSLISKYTLADAYLDTALLLALENNDYLNKLNEVNIYNLKGLIKSDQGYYNQSIVYYNKVLDRSKEIDYEKGIGKAYTNLAVSYYFKGDYVKAIDYYNMAIPIFEKVQDSLNLGLIHGNLAIFYEESKNYNKAIETFSNSLKYFKDSDIRGKAPVYLNLGVNCMQLLNYSEAIEYYNQAFELFEQLNDTRQIIGCLNNMAGCFVDMGLTNKGLKRYFDALRLAEEYKMKGDIAHINKSLAVTYTGLGNYSKAKEYSKKSISIAGQLASRDLLRENYHLRGDIDYNLNAFKEASNFYKKYIELNDSMYSVEYDQRLSEMEARYETEKKEQQIDLLRKDSLYTAARVENQQTKLDKQDTERNVFLISGALLVLIIGSVTYAFMQKRRDNKLISAQKKKVEQQKRIIETKSKDITDSIRYAEGIQKSILPTEKQVNKILPDNFILFKPKDIVSGDFYWLAENNNKVYFAACDCTGHGVPGALMSVVGTYLLNEAVNIKRISHPADIFEEVRRELKISLKQEGLEGEQRDGMDTALCAWDKKNKLEFALAYNSLFLIREGQLMETKPDKQPVGFHNMGEKPYTHHELNIEKGDTVYIFSDGYVDQFGGPREKKFMMKNFKKLLVSIQDKTMKEQKAILENTMKEWKGIIEQVDDILVMGVRF